ncbi:MULTISPECIES: hypothetical protein [Salinivibrio]|uniref:Uncharacterized protein n=1 Tax=Salinivibrio siamensis TaxID=414286 RepID=A0ABX3KCA8_9GAMM|nr:MULTISPECIES: hypothetical protein [Salinivibrio]KKA44063.1 hypothetical protein WN56_12620 [Salinivibrio sp. KP-1]MPS32445.1 hypothetical protein [Salinivibrio sp. VYel7]MPX90632.1 hypothetical protein [Salinivibrio sp. VYel1]MPX93838.1 hypothetical protein [Salinivibrio sp. VYel9]MPX96075.1 hypothetical protein [Salinivibrio sp. VYel6]
MNWLGNLSPVYRTPHAPPTKVWAIRKQAHIEERKQRRLDDPSDHHASPQAEKESAPRKKDDGSLDVYV